MRERTLIKDLNKHIDQYVLVAGWMHRLRILGRLGFLLLRDSTGFVQCVLNAQQIDSIKHLQVESVLSIRGYVIKKPNKEGLEVHVSEIEVISPVLDQVPVEINKDSLDAHLDTIIDHRPVTLRHEKQKAIFKVQAGILTAFRNAMIEEGFIEFRSPVLMGAPSESGASVFEVKYYDHKAYLAQSPQVYKQIMVGVFERVFTITPVFRAEKHNTTRHLMEITQMDGEVGFIEDYDECLEIIERVVRKIFNHLDNNYSKELQLWNTTLPQLPASRFPKVKVKEALQIIEKKAGKSAQRPELDLDPQDERLIAEWALEEYGSDFLWVLNFKKDKNFYTRNNPEDPDESLSFDLVCRGLEWLSGTHRIHDYNKLVENMKTQGLTLEYYEHYLEAFKYGIPYEAGFSFGLERMTQQIFRLKNIREAVLFPSDLDRIAGQRINTKQKV
jgi:nondiscriminating aspartyl-tRNA synthetase